MTTPPPKPCVGGYINKDTGACEGKCETGKCVADNTCVDNRCVLKCDSHLDCFHDGTQDCSPAIEDDTMIPFFACQSNAKALGVGNGCPFKTGCEAYSACPNGGACDLAMCGGMPDTCMKDDAACGDNPDCRIGKCAGDGSACTLNGCAASECQPLVCITKGEGDANAYCALPGCASDDDCAGGYYCGITPDPHELCGSNPQKGNDGHCGKTTDACIEASSLGQGNTLFEGSACILRKTCLKRTQCAPCKDNLDCSLVGTQTCVDIGGEMRCARGCAADKDCDPDSSCDAGSCKPRFGSCVGMGNFCDPCMSDEDCGANGSTKICFEYNGGQRACIDRKGGSCTMDSECPKAPNGLNGLCSNGVCLPPVFQDELSCW